MVGFTGEDGSTLRTLAGGGEAHLWAAGRGTVSVDLGYADTGKGVAKAHPKIVILTHSDSDHINGAIPFFADASKRERPCGDLHELWAPYEWAVLVGVFGKVITGNVSGDDVRRTERLAVPVGTADRDEFDSADDLTGDSVVWSGVLESDGDDTVDGDEENEVFVEEVVGTVVEALSDALRSGVIEARQTPSDREVSDVALDISKKATKLRRILSDADAAGWSIRWFSTDHMTRRSWLTSGEPGLATIVNAQEVEVQDPPGSAALLLHAAQLTVQNRRALAPYLWGLRAGGDAVIWSDGDGGGSGNLQDFPWQAIGVMSAPHHGSGNDAHEPVWASLCGSHSCPFIVRTGGFWRQKLHLVLQLLPEVISRSTYRDPGYRPGDAVWREGKGFDR